MSNELAPGEVVLTSPRSVVITGYFGVFYKDNNQPVLIQMPNNPSYWTVVYSSVEKLQESVAQLGIKGWKIVKITDGTDFVESLAKHKIRIMLDPYTVGLEKTRWTEVVPITRE